MKHKSQTSCPKVRSDTKVSYLEIKKIKSKFGDAIIKVK